ncbi:MAG: hypothetical protein HQL66_05630 [Magnetococcales bacterium]|nr:hypothetical protein [Magnetococcales bacterium]
MLKNTLSVGKQLKELLGTEHFDALVEEAKAAAEKAEASTTRLSDAELAALHGYTDHTRPDGENDYQVINGALRDGSREELKLLAPYINALIYALEKLPDYAGDVTRVTNLPQHVAETLAPGGTYSDPAFMSTATGLSRFRGKYLFFIKSKTGKYIAPLSMYPYQHEVLYPPGKEFIIEAVRETAGGKVEVDLKEK